MKIRLNKPIVGYKREDNTTRVHADEDDTLLVIFHNSTHYICDSVKYPGTPIVVFPSQCSEVIPEEQLKDPFEEEKYYHVYEGLGKSSLDDSLYTEFEPDDTD